MPILSVVAAPLAPLDADVRLTDELLARLSLLAPLQRRPALYRFRGSVALRRYRAGDVVIRQGERGRGAFYVLTAADTLALLSQLCRNARPRRPDPDLVAERESVRLRLESSENAEPVLGLGQRAGPRLARSGEPYRPELDARFSMIGEGELVAEAACLEGTPQPITVSALRDCYLLEMKADFLAAVQDDPMLRARADATYRTHILRLQLARLPLFEDLSEQEFALISEDVQLKTVSPGVRIRDEYEECDGLFIVRSGIVKLATNRSSLLAPEEIADWTRLREALRDGAGGRSAAGILWRRLAPSARSLLSGPGTVGGPNPAERMTIVRALNELLVADDWLREPELRPFTDGVLSPGPGEVARRANRFAMEAILGGAIRPLENRRGPECVLTYVARGEVFGLQELLLSRSFSATAVALGHPNALGRVELAFLPAEAFWRLLRQVPRLLEPLKRETVRQRQNADRRLATRPWEDQAEHFSSRAVELGLVQGQQLMLIDLDRCTRCDDCVRACASSRDDGLSRLFLDGPRFGRHLVPTTCRSCLDPVCLIGCPVSSIHRGPGHEIRIENWCIGCGLCSESCPYGAIQLHDSGLIPEASTGWRFATTDSLRNSTWQRPGYRVSGWLQGSTPFVFDRVLREQLRCSRPDSEWGGFAFRHEFRLTPSTLKETSACRLEIQSPGEVRVWVNGREYLPADKPRGGRHIYTIAIEDGTLHSGANLVAVELRLPADNPEGRELLFQARLDTIRSTATMEAPSAPANRPVTRRAAVCDLCADQPAGPACIQVCAHDAALRVDARKGLPK